MSDVYEFVHGNVPLLVSVPHDGRRLPDEISARMTPAARALPDTDWHVAKLYDFAADLYLRWYEAEAEDARAEVLNDVAWRLYLSGRELERAIDIAQRSFEVESEPETADTLARLLYVTGAVAEAVALEERAAREAEGSRSETYSWVAQRMEAREPLEDEPAFESYPGQRRRAL